MVVDIAGIRITRAADGLIAPDLTITPIRRGVRLRANFTVTFTAASAQLLALVRGYLIGAACTATSYGETATGAVSSVSVDRTGTLEAVTIQVAE